jgi:hypothetical protein
MLWEQLYGTPDSSDGANSIKETPDGGFIVAGFTAVKGNGDYDYWVLKLDSFGNIVWEKTYGGDRPDTAYSVDLTADGGYIVAGETWSFGSGNNDFWIIKLDSEGNLIRSNTYGGEKHEMAKCIQRTADNGFIVAGYTNSFGSGNNDCWLLRLDSDCNLKWARLFGGSNYDSANSVYQTGDGNFIVGADTESFGSGEFNLLLFKISE